MTRLTWGLRGSVDREAPRRAAIVAVALVVAAACSPAAAVPEEGGAPVAADPSPPVVAAAPVTLVVGSTPVVEWNPIVPSTPVVGSTPVAMASEASNPSTSVSIGSWGATSSSGGVSRAEEDPPSSDEAEGSGTSAEVASGVAAPAPVASAPGAAPEPPARPFSMNLYHSGDWVGQYTLTWCVGASIQMMVNVAQPGQDRTKSQQADYMLKAQGGEKLSARGASAWGWAAALTDLGVGNYTVAYAYDYQEGLRTAAKAMRETRLPVGLLVWGGKHAWVMTGFTSVGDPGVNSNFRVTGVRVLDPLYPRANSDLGPSPAPGTLLKPSTLDNYFVGWSWWSRKGSASTQTGNSSWLGSSYDSWRLVLPIARL